ncbi:MAG TPA: Ig-like domain repeat protein [Acidimicrobiales bacterium]|nr:Ig-like domain repeat protein [Acidimicrobiales bacterium]
MTKRLSHSAVLFGLAFSVVLVGGLLAYVAATPASASTSLSIATVTSPQTAGSGFVVNVDNATAAASVTLALTTAPSGSTLVCAPSNTAIANASGVTTFNDCVINNPSTGSGDILGATDTSGDSPGSSNPFVVLGPAAKLVFTTEPSATASGGTAFGTQPVVSIEDTTGNVVTTNSSTVTLALAGSPTGVTFSCTSNAPAASAGVASFAGCKINLAGTYSLTATDGTLTVAVSSSIQVSVGPAAQLSFTTEPSNSAVPGTAFSVQPVVSVEDAGGNVVTSGTNSNASVTLALTSAAAGATLACTANSVSASAGVTTFAGCKISPAGRYSLTASASGLSSAVSTGITNGGTTAVTIARSSPTRTASQSSAVFTASVAKVSGTGTLTGSVSYAVDGSAASGCTELPLNSGLAKCTIAFDSPGRYKVTATYGNDPLFNSSSASVTQVVVNRVSPKEIDIFEPSASVSFGSPVRLRVHLYGSCGTVSGKVTVEFAGEAIRSATLVKGVASWRLSAAVEARIRHGKHTLVVLYKGQSLYLSHDQDVVITIT